MLILAVCCYTAAAAFIWCTNSLSCRALLDEKTAKAEDLVSMSVSEITPLLEEKSEMTDSLMVLAKADGTVLAYAGMECFFQTEAESSSPDEMGIIALCAGEIQKAVENGEPVSLMRPLWKDADFWQKAVTIVHPCGNSANWCALRILPTQSGEDDTVLIICPSLQALSEQRKLECHALLIFLFILGCVAATIGSLVNRRMMRPLTAVTRQLEQIGHGNFDICVAEVGSRRMRNLARTLNNTCAKLEELDQSRSEFVSNASHELKTPLATMKALLENILYSPKMDAETRTDFLTAIDREINRLSMIVRDLLTLVGMDSKSVRLSRTCFRFSGITRDTVDRLKPMIDQKGQHLSLEIQNECPMYADEPKLTQVVYNLLENACKYTPNGGNISVLLRQSNHEAILTVADSGPGIPKEDQEHIFERFYRVDKARSRETGGTGLGLSIVRQMVLLHGGTVTVSSDGVHGTTFKVTLQIHQEPPKD